MASQFQVYKDKAGEFRWRLLADNHKIIAQSSEGYRSKQDALHGAQILSRPDRVAPQVYQGKDGYRFRYTATNGKIIAVGEAYKEAGGCTHAIGLIEELAPGSPVIDKT